MLGQMRVRREAQAVLVQMTGQEMAKTMLGHLAGLGMLAKPVLGQMLPKTMLGQKRVGRETQAVLGQITGQEMVRIRIMLGQRAG